MAAEYSKTHLTFTFINEDDVTDTKRLKKTVFRFLNPVLEGCTPARSY